MWQVLEVEILKSIYDSIHAVCSRGKELREFIKIIKSCVTNWERVETLCALVDTTEGLNLQQALYFIKSA